MRENENKIDSTSLHILKHIILMIQYNDSIIQLFWSINYIIWSLKNC